MSKCPDCGRESLQEHEGHMAFCGRFVNYNDAPGVLFAHPDQWRERMYLVQICKKAKPVRPIAAVSRS